MVTHNPIICALDTTDVSQATHVSRQVAGSVGALKLGLEFFTANGIGGVRNISERRLPIFLDLKFHDIPNTVAGAIKGASAMHPFMMTVHTAGGKAMLQAAANAAQEVAASSGKPKALIIGVTVLTSFDQDDLTQVGVRDTMQDQVKRMADLALSSGLDGVVCSSHEITLLREHCGPDFKLIVPGIRPAGSATDDQKRVMTPKEAMDKGADYLVIGRPITAVQDSKKAAEAILKTL